MAVIRLGQPAPSASQLPPFFCWKRSSLLPGHAFSPPGSSFPPGASAWAAQTAHGAGGGENCETSQTTRNLSKHICRPVSFLTSFSFSFSSASASFTLLTNICLISSSLRCRSVRNSFLLASYVSWRLGTRVETMWFRCLTATDSGLNTVMHQGGLCLFVYAMSWEQHVWSLWSSEKVGEAFFTDFPPDLT